MSEKIRGTNLWTRFSLLLTYALFLSLWFCQALFLPVESNAAVADLMHNSANPKIGTTKYGTWGTTWNCATCHNDTTTNIKMVVPSIVPPWTTTTRQVVFNKITSTTVTYLGVMGNDERSVLSRSTNICEVCHTKTKFHQYSSNSVTTPVANATHKNRADCTQTCHPHSAGFAISVTGCTACHGNPPSTTAELTTNAFTYAGVPGAHVKHSSYAPAIACITCHQGTNITMTSGDNKVNLGFQINKANWPQYSPPANSTAASAVVVNSNYANWQVAAPTTSTTAANTMTCSVYCHAGWTGAGGTQNPVSWATTGPLACNSCHYSTQTEVNTAGASAPGSHYKHAASTQQNYACTACHGATLPTTTSHVNGDSKVTFTAGGKYKGFPNFTSASAKSSGAAYGTCTATACHGQNSPAAWGTAVNPTSGNVCQKCHGSLTAAFNNFSSPTIAPGYGTDGRDTGGNTAATSARVGAHQGHLQAQSGISDPIHCGECHTTHTTVQDSTHLNYSTATIAFGPLSKAQSHPSPSVTRVSGALNCNAVYCHSGKYNTGTVPAWNNTSLLNGTFPSDCGKCHGLPPATSDHTGIATLTALPITTCGCHNNINSSATTYAGIFYNKSLHINGIIEGGDCLSCHNKIQGTAPNQRAAVVGQFAAQSHHVQKAGGITKTDCYQCHMEANADGSPNPTYHLKTSKASVDLAIWSGGVRSTTYISYTANSANRKQAVKLNLHCLGCHRATGPINPFGDSYTPSKYAWDAKSIQERYSTPVTTPWGKYNIAQTNKKATVTKALSAHGNAVANKSMNWDTTNGIDGATALIVGATSNVVCYDCHNSHGSTVAGITSQYSSATGRNKGGILKDIVAGTGGYTADYKPAAHTATGPEHNTFNPGATLCFDCHNTKSAGVLMAGYTSSHRAPWGYNSTFGVTKSIGGYSDTPYFGNYTVNSAKRYVYKQGTAGAKAKPMGGHYGTSIAPQVSAITKQTVAPGVAVQPGINGLCTPCHDPHGVSPNTAYIANQTYAVPLLKGSWVTSPYKEDVAAVNINRGGGSTNGPTKVANNGSIPGYYIDQNTFVADLTTRSTTGVRFASVATNAKTGTGMPNIPDTTGNGGVFGGLCVQCHTKANLTDTVAASSTTWKTKNRIHQSVSGWASTAGGNASNKMHAYTCSKCHAPHTSKLPRLLVTNCLNVNHRNKVITGGSVLVGTPTNVRTTALNGPGNSGYTTSSSGSGAGRFPAGGGRYSTTTARATTPGPWGFGVTGTAAPAYPAPAAAYGSNCHQSSTAGGTAYSPTTQQWNTKSPW